MDGVQNVSMLRRHSSIEAMRPPFRRFLALLVVALPASSHAEMKREVFGHTAENQEVEIITLINPQGLRARVMAWGGALVEMSVPDRSGKLADVTLGFDTLAPYLQKHP